MSVKLETICRVFLGLLLTLSSFFGIAGVIITGAVFIFSPDAIFELIQNTFTIHSSNASVEALAIQEFLTELIKDTAFANLLWSAGIAFLVPLSFGFMGGISLLRQKSIFRLSPSLVFLLIWILSIAGIGVFGIQLAPKIQEFVLQSQEGLIWIH